MGLFSRKNKQERVAEDSGRFYSKDDDAAIGERARAKRATNAGGAAGRRPGNDPMLPEKKRARRRLVGAIALALAAAVGLPMLLDSQPKPLAGDIAIQIPAKDKAAPLPVPAADKSVAAADSVDKGEEVVDAPAPAAANSATPAAPKPAAQPDSRTVAPVAATPSAQTPAERNLEHNPARTDTLEPEHKPDTRLADREKAEKERAAKERAARDRADKERADKERAERERIARAERDAKQEAAKAKLDDKPVKPAKAQDDAARAMAILEGKSADKAHAAEASGQRFVVQAAAMSSAEKAAEVQAKLREAGIASYTEKSAAGGLIRVRVGPLSREDAEKMRAKVGRLGYSGNMIPL